MSKTTVSYWNPLISQQNGEWEIIDDTDNKIEQIIV